MIEVKKTFVASKKFYGLKLASRSAPVVKSGQAFRPFTPETRVRIPTGAFKFNIFLKNSVSENFGQKKY